jgi:hypothetical protein
MIDASCLCNPQGTNGPPLFVARHVSLPGQPFWLDGEAAMPFWWEPAAASHNLDAWLGAGAGKSMLAK